LPPSWFSASYKPQVIFGHIGLVSYRSQQIFSKNDRAKEKTQLGIACSMQNGAPTFKKRSHQITQSQSGHHETAIAGG
jgi:hypothetical protein